MGKRPIICENGPGETKKSKLEDQSSEENSVGMTKANKSVPIIKSPERNQAHTGLQKNQNNARKTSNLCEDIEKDEFYPLESLSQLDLSFLQALPKGIRQELEISFVHRKLQKRCPVQQSEKSNKNKTTKPKVTAPISSSKSKKERINSTSPTLQEANRLVTHDPRLTEEVKSPENVVYRAVQKLPGVSGALFGQVNWWHFNHKDELPTHKDSNYVLMKKNLSPPILRPALNNETDVRKIRDLIREAMITLSNPTAEDVNPLMEYFKLLIYARYLRQTTSLLKFLRRLTMNKDTRKCWKRIFEHIIANTQKRCTQIFGCPVELED